MLLNNPISKGFLVQVEVIKRYFFVWKLSTIKHLIYYKNQ
jgi:hypothetical protein